MSLREAIACAARGEEVPGPMLEGAFGEIMAGEAPEAAIAGLLVALRTKGESVAEIVDRSGILEGRVPWYPGRAREAQASTTGN